MAENSAAPSSPASPSEPEKIIAETLQLALSCHEAGRLTDAEALYRSILEFQPRHARANHHLGLLLMQTGKLDTALDYLTNACAVAPETGSHWIGVADCLLRLNRPLESIQVLETAIQAGLKDAEADDLLTQARANLTPDKPAEDPLAELKVLVKRSIKRATVFPKKSQDTTVPKYLARFLDTSDWPGLQTAAQEALGKTPVHGKTWDLLGMAYLQLDRNDAALIALTRASQLLPSDAATWDHLGVAQRQARQHQLAEQSFKRSLVLDSLRPETWVNLGNLQLEQVRPEAAIASFERALELRPDFVAALANLGSAYRDAGQLEAAAASCRLALQAQPNLAEAHCNLGNALRDFRQQDEAIASYQRALVLKPNLAEAHSGLARVLIDQGQIAAAIACYQQALLIRPDFIEARSNLLQSLNALAAQPPWQCLEEARRYGEQVAKTAKKHFSSWRHYKVSQPLRLGLVSGDLGNHPVGYFLENLLGQLDPAQVKLFAYPTSKKEDPLTARLRPHFSAWKPLCNRSNEDAAEQIHSDGINILLDLSGHTAHTRLPLFAWKPAPVQASWLGYFATTGVTEMDYLIGDPHVTPEEEESHFTEAVWRLPETYLCFTPPDVVLDVAPLPALTTACITFGCFNNLAKMNDEVVSLWARVLQAVPRSRLNLKTKQLDLPSQRELTRQRFAAHGITDDRLILEGHSPRAELLAAYNRVDVALDPFPYPGGTTTVEGLWMGVPAITRRGDRFLSHVGESIARNAGLPDWIAADDDDYVAKAVAHTGDLARLASLRAGLRPQVLASPLFDAPRFARHFEAALWGMWHKRFPQGGEFP
jgi:predicted O-linked N-acetylglucosamine transferase (SPINDLY family)